jgi:uncharacterized protein (DUF169 family)
MTTLDVLHQHAKSLQELLRLKTHPLAIKLLEQEKDIPKEAIRPKRDYGYRLMTCQAFCESRKAGKTIAQTKDDMWCFEAALGYGFIEPLSYFLEGNTRYPEGLVSSWEAAKFWSQHFPRLEHGRYEAIVSAPLAETMFEPDLVMMYADPAQVQQLLVARIWIDGHDIAPRLSGMGACVMSVTPVVQSKECYVTVPCPGDRGRASAQDDELIFSTPIEKIGSLIEGLKALQKIGLGTPFAPALPHQPQQLDSYMEIGRMVGMVD